MACKRSAVRFRLAPPFSVSFRSARRGDNHHGLLQRRCSHEARSGLPGSNYLCLAPPPFASGFGWLRASEGDDVPYEPLGKAGPTKR